MELVKDVSSKSVESIGEIDYAILKSVSYNVNTIPDLGKILQVRTIILERHIYNLINGAYINIDTKNKVNVTVKGNETISKFENENPDKWNPINDFIVSSIKNKKEERKKFYKMVDILLLISMIIIIGLIIYFVKDLLGLDYLSKIV